MALKLHRARRLTVRAWNALKAAKVEVVFISGNSAQLRSTLCRRRNHDAAIVAVAKAFADRGLRDGVQVDSILPGPVITGRRRSYLEHCARAQCQRRGRDEAFLKDPNKPIRRARIDRRLNGLPRLPWGAVDDRFSASYRWWRGNIHLTRALHSTRIATRKRNMNDKSMAAAAIRENGTPSICVFDINGTLLDIEYIAPVFQRLFGDSNVLREWFGRLVLYSNMITLSGPFVPFFDLGQGVLRMLGEIHHVRIKTPTSRS